MFPLPPPPPIIVVVDTPDLAAGIDAVIAAAYSDAYETVEGLRARSVRRPATPHIHPHNHRATRGNTLPALSEAQMRALIEAFFRPEWVDEALDVSHCESRWVPDAQNRRSSAGGVFQFLDRTWLRFGHGAKYDPVQNVAAAAKMVEHYVANGWNRWAGWSCKP